MRIDLLAALHENRITVSQAEAIDSEIMASQDASRVAELLGLNTEEWTAFCHGVPFQTLAKWRYEGWPSTCSKCGELISIQKFGWLAVEKGNKFVLTHVTCPRSGADTRLATEGQGACWPLR